MPRKRKRILISDDQAREYELLDPLLNSILNEVKEFAKKKQDEPLNKLKVRATNKVLSRIKTLLLNEPTAEFLELLDEDTLPTNSDAVIVMAQHLSSMRQFRDSNYGYDSIRNEHRWFTKEDP